MLKVRRFKVVYRHPDLKVDALNIDEADGRIVNYTGKKLKIKLK
jgi:glycosyl hydrolase, family 31